MEMKEPFNGNIMESDNDLRPAIVQQKLGRKSLIILAIIFLIALILLIVGIVLIVQATKTCEKESKAGKTGKQVSAVCEYSEEAKRMGLDAFLAKVQSTYYVLHHEASAWHPDATTDTVRKEFRPYDPTPEAIKKRTDTAMALLKEISSKTVNSALLKTREYKALLQVKHYLKYVFGTPFDGNYYAGTWMLGPNSLCWVPMCSLGSDIYNNIGHMKPRNVDEVYAVLKQFEGIRDTVNQYRKNIALGVKTGMIRTRKECRAGLDALKKSFHVVSEEGAKGVLKDWYTKPFINNAFYDFMKDNENGEWQKKHGKMVNESIQDALIKNVGTPIHELFKYLEKDHYRHCRPDSEWAGGLSALPIDFIYTDEKKNLSAKTTKMLPLKDKNGKYPMINGSYAYELILGFFTTTDMPPKEIYEIGQKRLAILYAQALEIAINVTGESNKTQAVSEFQKRLLDLKTSYFNDEEIPKNESEGDAFTNCSTIAKAKLNCPNRWRAMEKWFAFARKVMAKLDPKTVNMFYFTGQHHTTPNCPIDLMPDFNPTTAAQSYSGSNSACSYKSVYNIPFFLKNVGPKYSEYSVNAHEARPGHHTQVQGNTEHFRDKCGGSIKWLDDQTYYTAFTEGWALYAENPLIAQNTDTYKHELMQKYGMLKWQIWRALRLIVDTGMHALKMSRAEAAKYFEDYAWDKTDLADKEITRYQSNPGQALGYMLGQLKIIELREYSEKELGENFSLKEFHYQTLSQGSSPLSFLDGHIKNYVACKKSPKKAGCDSILNPPKSTSEKSQVTKKKSDLNLYQPPIKNYL